MSRLRLLSARALCVQPYCLALFETNYGAFECTDDHSDAVTEPYPLVEPDATAHSKVRYSASPLFSH